MAGDRRLAAGVGVLSLAGLGCALLIVVGEAYGSPERRGFWMLGGAALGAIFVIYSLILLLLRRMGTIGPRRAER
jgi:ABC-type Fe3+-siderophore transport system permease subunit